MMKSAWDGGPETSKNEKSVRLTALGMKSGVERTAIQTRLAASAPKKKYRFFTGWAARMPPGILLPKNHIRISPSFCKGSCG